MAYVGDSRALTFADEIMAFTGGEGVDIVLNTLPAKTLPKSLSLLKTLTGRCVDIVNMYSEDLLDLRAMIRGASFFTFDLEAVFRKDSATPAVLFEMLKKICRGFADRTYSPLPHRIFPVSDIASAFLCLQKGRQIGKVAVAMDEGGVRISPSRERIEVSADATYLVTGGLGGFGLATAKWLADCGARHLVLIGRSGASSPETLQQVAAIRESGVTVLVEAVDVTSPEQLRGLFDLIDQTLPPLRGVVHAAMVLNDEYVMRMRSLALRKVILPKLLGAWHLHELTLNRPLDFFICFSSFASLVGNIGQANYAAANAFLDSFADYRRSLGLPALTLSWGAVGESGYLTRHPELAAFLKRQGVTALTHKQAWTMICHGLEHDLVHAGLMRVAWPVYREYGLAEFRTRRFREIFGENEAGVAFGAGNYSGSLVLPKEARERQLFLAELLGKKVAEALGLPRDQLDESVALESFGFDSLMATELVIDIERMVNVTLPKMTLLQGGMTIGGLVEIVEKELGKILPGEKTVVPEAEPAAGAKRAVTGPEGSSQIN